MENSDTKTIPKIAEAKLYKINLLFARENKLPVFFVARQLKETPKAAYLYGAGTLETQKMGMCCVCGRTLTHPVSVLLGIGPECGQHWHDWDRVGGYTEENLEKLKGLIKEISIDSWVPKGCIKEVLPTKEIINIPENHPMLKSKEKKDTGRVAGFFNYKNNPVIFIVFDYNPEDLKRVKTIPGRRFINENGKRFWICPVTKSTIELLIKWDFKIKPKLMEFLSSLPSPKKAPSLKVKDLSAKVTLDKIPGLKGELFPFQKEGVQFIDEHDGRALVADEMGLGKTIQALAYLQLHPKLRPAVVVCPASLKLNWKKEVKDWMTGSSCQVISGKKPTIPLYGDILIINYDILNAWVDTISRKKPKIMITDECHYYKSNTAQRTKAVKKLARQVDKIIALSGTPIVNRPVEMFNAINLINPLAIPSFWEYTRRYCGRTYNGFGWDFSGATNTEELNKLLKESIMIRRKKEDVLKELPDKLYSFVPIALENENEYFSAERNFLDFIRRTKGAGAAEKASGAQALTEIGTLKQLAVKGKLNESIKWIKDFIDNDEKIIIFAVHKFVIDTLMESFPDISVKIDGSVSQQSRHKAVESFQNDPKIKIFVGNIQAAGVGLTLTAASNVAFLELPWTPGELSQAEDRAHRIGQQNAVTIHYLLANNTIEEKIAKLLDKKRKVLDSVLDGKVTKQESLLSELMNSYK
jgi:SNF2 family DNA or RNA helicase